VTGPTFDQEIYEHDETATLTIPICESTWIVTEFPAADLPEVLPPPPPPIPPTMVRGGYYRASNGDPREHLDSGTNLRAFQQYHGFGEPAASIFPGKPWVLDLLASGAMLNLVVELKSYGNTAAQSFSVDGRSYTVPAMAGQFQLATSPTAFWSYDQVTSGACDGLWHRLLSALRTIPEGARVNVQLASEVDLDNQGGYKHNGTLTAGPSALDSRSVAAYSRIIDWLHSPPTGVPGLSEGVTFSLGFAGQWSGRDRFVRCHPDTLPVDIVQWNCYNHGADQPAEKRLRETLAYRSACGPRMRSLPIVIAEWGSSEAWPGGQAAYMAAMGPAVATVNTELRAAGEGEIIAMNWFGSRDTTWGQFPTDPTASRAALAALYGSAPFVPIVGD
jgi:hypothetical protein